jgi:hypothetical protein
MTPVIQNITALGYELRVKGEKVVCRWTRPEPPDPEKVKPALDALRHQKHAVWEFLRNRPGDCDNCPACGHWDGYGPWRLPPGRYCFHAAVFEGRARRPVLAREAKPACPKADHDEGQ